MILSDSFDNFGNFSISFPLKMGSIKPSPLHHSGIMEILENLLVPTAELPFREGLLDKMELRDCVRIILQTTTDIKLKEKVYPRDSNENSVANGILSNISHRILSLLRLLLNQVVNGSIMENFRFF